MFTSDELVQAVNLAVQPADQSSNAQALLYLQEIEANALSWLPASLELIVKPETRVEAVFLAFQVIDRSMSQEIDVSSLNKIRETVFQCMENDNIFPVNNKLGETLKSLFYILYPEQWGSFFDDVINLGYTKSGPEVLVALFQAINTDIGDQLFLRTSEKANRATILKDAIRINDAPKIVQAMIALLESPLLRVREGSMNALAGWSSWADITLIIPSLPQIEAQLQNQETVIAAVNALCEIISKKMPPAHKLDLLNTANLAAAVTAVAPPLGDNLDADEAYARLSNGVLFEASHTLSEGNLDDNTKAGLLQTICSIVPLVLSYMGHEYDDVTQQLFPSLTEFLNFLRKETKAGRPVPEVLKPHLSSIFKQLVLKSKYEPEDFSLDDDENEFLEFRMRLRSLQDTVAQIDQNLFFSGLSDMIASELQPENSWMDVELAIYELSIFGDNVKLMTTRSLRMKTLSAELHQVLQSFNQLLLLMVQHSSSQSPSYTHPAVMLLFMELATRHPKLGSEDGSGFTNTHETALNVYLNASNHTDERVRLKAWYSLSRFVKIVTPPSSGAELIFGAINHWLPITVSLNEVADTNVDVMIVAAKDAKFRGQLNLYELCGILFASNNTVEGAQKLLAILFNNIDINISAARTFATNLSIHYNLAALASFVRGITTTKKPDPGSELAMQLHTAASMVVAVLQQVYEFKGLREACRQAFSRLLACLGNNLLTETSAFVNILLQCSSSGLNDLHSFVGQLAHEFAGDGSMQEMLTALCTPLLSQTFAYLDQCVTAMEADPMSTDATVELNEAVASYLQLLTNISNNQFIQIFTANENVALLPTLFASLIKYSQSDTIMNAKLAVVTLVKFVPLMPNQSIATDITELCWKLSDKPNVMKNAQSRSVISELAGLQFTLLSLGGPEYAQYLDEYLTKLGASGVTAELVSKTDLKDFKQYFMGLQEQRYV